MQLSFIVYEMADYAKCTVWMHIQVMFNSRKKEMYFSDIFPILGNASASIFEQFQRIPSIYKYNLDTFLIVYIYLNSCQITPPMCSIQPAKSLSSTSHMIPWNESANASRSQRETKFTAYLPI